MSILIPLFSEFFKFCLFALGGGPASLSFLTAVSLPFVSVSLV